MHFEYIRSVLSAFEPVDVANSDDDRSRLWRKICFGISFQENSIFFLNYYYFDNINIMER